MRILNEDNGESINSVLIMLTPSEAAELASKIKSIKSEEGEHVHVDDLELSREITVLVYTPQNLDYFNEVVRKAINEE